MLREITPEDVGNYIVGDICVIHDDVFYTLEEFLDDLDCRVLIDYIPFVPLEPYRDEDADQEDDDEEEPEEEPAPQKKLRRSSEELRAAVLEAWDNGNRTISQVMNMVDCTYATAKRYIDGR